jgi:intraflagellar transport protein 46
MNSSQFEKGDLSEYTEDSNSEVKDETKNEFTTTEDELDDNIDSDNDEEDEEDDDDDDDDDDDSNLHFRERKNMSVIDKMNALDPDETSESISIRQTKNDLRKENNDSNILSKNKSKSSFGGQLLTDAEDSDNDINIDERKKKMEEDKLLLDKMDNITDEMKELFIYINTYQPEEFTLIPQLKCFIPDYIPAVGDIDPIIKIPKPNQDEKTSNLELGTEVLDEPAAKQTDPALLDLELRASLLSTSSDENNKNVYSINLNFNDSEEGREGMRELNKWVENAQNLYSLKPSDRVIYSKRMADIEDLMAEWPPEIDEFFSSNDNNFSIGQLDLPLQDICKLVCSILDIPVYSSNNNNTNQKSINEEEDEIKPSLKRNHRNLIESMHTVFSLYAEFKNSQHFGKKINKENF